MPKVTALENRITNIQSTDEFNGIALEIFHFQYENNSIYKSFVDFLNIDISGIDHYSLVPFLPIEFFKDHKVISGDCNPDKYFSSSGTTGIKTSKHYIINDRLYKESFTKAFNLFFGNIEDYVLLALLPSYLERKGSSLVFMTDRLINDTRNVESGFYLDEYDQLNEVLLELKKKQKKTILIGVTYALLDFAEKYKPEFPELIIIETGGMKGRKKEMIRDEVHAILKKNFDVNRIYSEYGMTELFSQAYSMGDGIFNCPPWMKVLIRNLNDPMSLVGYGKSGGLNIIDLANIYSCSFIATQDLGKLYDNGTFEVLGRFDNSDVRGCNLMLS